MFPFDNEILELKDYINEMRFKVSLGIFVYHLRKGHRNIIIQEVSSQGFKIKRFAKTKIWITWDEYDTILRESVNEYLKS